MSGAPDDPTRPVAPDLDQYDGQWVAVRDRLVVANAPDEVALRRQPSVRETDLCFPIGDPVTGFYMINV